MQAATTAVIGMPTKAKDHTMSFLHKLKDRARRIGPFGWAAILAAGALLATGTVIGLIVLTPVFIIFSPILVPLGFILFLCTAGVLTAAGAAIATVSAITWLYRYYKNKHPVGSDKVDYAVSRVHYTAQQATHKTRDVATQVQAKAHEAVAAA